MIQVVQRAAAILELLASSPERRVGLGEIAAKLDLNAGTCANILKTLVACGLADQPDRKKGYQLGPRVFQWAGGAAYMEHIVGPARKIMAALRDAIDENVILALVRGGERIVLWEELATHELQVKRTHVKPAYEASTGRLMLAFMAEAERQKFLDVYGLPSESAWPEGTTQETLDAELSRIRARRLAIQITTTHILGLAVPVEKDGLVVAALGIYLPRIRADEGRLDMLKTALAVASAELSDKLTGEGGHDGQRANLTGY